jgi:hypothetical protein
MKPFVLLVLVFVALFVTAYLNVFHPVGNDHDYAQEYSCRSI